MDVRCFSRRQASRQLVGAGNACIHPVTFGAELQFPCKPDMGEREIRIGLDGRVERRLYPGFGPEEAADTEIIGIARIGGGGGQPVPISILQQLPLLAI